jgi:hypothetical protein
MSNMIKVNPGHLSLSGGHTRVFHAGVLPFKTTFGAGLPQPDAVRETLDGDAALSCRLMIELCNPAFRDNLRASNDYEAKVIAEAQFGVGSVLNYTRAD